MQAGKTALAKSLLNLVHARMHAFTEVRNTTQLVSYYRYLDNENYHYWTIAHFQDTWQLTVLGVGSPGDTRSDMLSCTPVPGCIAVA